MCASLRPASSASGVLMLALWAYVALLALVVPGTAADSTSTTPCTTVSTADEINEAIVPGGSAHVCISSDVDGSECAPDGFGAWYMHCEGHDCLTMAISRLGLS